MGYPCNATPTLVQYDGGNGAGLAARAISMFDDPCVVTTDGTVACWGDNTDGQLGNGEVGGSTSAPTIIPNFSGVAKVSTVAATVCALKTDGSIWCWGRNVGLGHAPGTHGDLLCNGGQCAPSPAPVYQSDDNTPAFGPASDAGVLPASDLAVGNNSACAIVGGDVWCWGSDAEGLVGPAAAGSHFYPSKLPIAGATSVSMSLSNACVAENDGGVTCWGEDPWGELGLGYQVTDASTGGCDDGYGCLPPTPLPNLGGVVQVATAFCIGLALKADGTVWAWGQNDTARLGHTPGEDGDQWCEDPRDNQKAYCDPAPSQVTPLP